MEPTSPVNDNEKSLASQQDEVSPPPPEFGDADAIKQLHLIGVEHKETKTISFSGPIPPPEMLEAYNQIVPNLAERLIVAFEEQAKHRQLLEKSVVLGGTVTLISLQALLRGQIGKYSEGVSRQFHAHFRLNGVPNTCQPKVPAGNQCVRSNRGLVFGFILALIALLGSMLLIYIGRDISGLTIFITAIVSLVGVFVYQTRERKNERLARSRTRAERATTKKSDKQ